MTPKAVRRGLLLAPFALLALGACSEESRDSIRSDAENLGDEAGEALDDAEKDAVELLARNIATEQGEEQFNDAGNALDGKLSCEATVGDDVGKVTVSCTGTTQDGGEAALEGETDEIPGASVTELEGSFVGTVDGEEVFTADRLGG